MYTVKLCEGEFPDWAKVLPEGNPIATVTFNPELLAQLVKVVKAAIDDKRTIPAITVEIYEKSDEAAYPYHCAGCSRIRRAIDALWSVAMDPNACLQRIDEALAESDFVEAREASLDLMAWLSLGGFDPDWNARPVAREWYFEEVLGHVEGDE